MKKVLIFGMAWLVPVGVLQGATPAMDPAGEQGSTIEMAHPALPDVSQEESTLLTPIDAIQATISCDGADVVLSWQDTDATATHHYNILRGPEIHQDFAVWIDSDFAVWHDTSTDADPLATTWADAGAGCDGSSHFYMVESVDGSGATQINHDLVAAKLSYPLLTEWNLVSFPVTQSDNGILEVLKTVDWDCAEYYDAGSPMGPWLTHCTYKPPELNDLWFLTREMGFWLLVTGPGTTWAVAGSVPLNTQVAAYVEEDPTWNMIGYPYFDNPVMTALEFKDMVESQNPDCSVVAMEVGDQSYPYGVRPLEPWEEMQHGKGYWVQLDGECTIEFTNILSKRYFVDELNRNIELLQEMDAPPAAETRLDKAETELRKAIEGFEEDVVEWALVKMRRAVGHLMEAEDRGANCGMIIENVYGLARTIADIAIEDAIEVAGEEDAHVLKAQEYYSSSMEMQENGMYEKAVKELRKAYREAIKAF